jgi:3-phenylpropionate/trans-cinnamate dioxygenase ferredoxin reductase subunit
VHVLRTLAHAQSLRASLLSTGPGTRDQRLVIVGGGFLGLEVAASARNLGAQVTVVEPVPGDPLASRIGPVAAAKLVELHRAQGVRVLTGVGVTTLTGDTDAPSPYVESGGEPDRRQPVREVHLTDGTVLPADVVLVAIGSDPCVEWLESSGLLVDDGVVCDEYCAAGPNIWAAGDVARWLHRGLDRHVRLEHRTNATEQGRHVAQNILGAKLPFEPVPFFWTDHFATKIQLAGTLAPSAEATIVEGDIASDAFVQTFSVGGVLRGVLCWNSPRRMTAYRNLLEDCRADP